MTTKIHEEMLMCGQKCPRCPVVTVHDDGSIVTIDEDGLVPQKIVYNATQAAKLRDILIDKLPK